MGQGARIHFNSDVVGKFLDNGETDFMVKAGENRELRCTLRQQERQWILTGQVTINQTPIYYAKVNGRRRSDPRELFNRYWETIPKKLRNELETPDPKDIARAFKNSVKKRYVRNLWHKIGVGYAGQK